MLLIKGGDWFVDGATGLARRFGLSELLIGATVVSIGTTLPEVMVSASSALSGHGELAYGNAIGSVICNTALIAALSTAIRPGRADPKSLRLPVSFFFLAAVLYAGIAYGRGTFLRLDGLVLLGIFLVYMVCTVLQMKSGAQTAQTPEAHPLSPSRCVLLLAAGALLIAVGADLLVDNGTRIAQALGVPESVIALTFVALGTSLPELFTSVAAAAKGNADIAIGNIVGSNIFNILFVVGVSALITPVPFSAQFYADMWTAAAAGVMLFVCSIKGRKLGRPGGIAMLAGYALYFVFICL